MTDTGHSFPMPEKAAEQLDEIKDELGDEPVRKLTERAHAAVKESPWISIACSTALGFAVGFSLGRCVASRR